MKTKEKILLCTLELAAEKGLGKVSLSQIADRVGVQKATLFSHYKSKEQIIVALYKYLRNKSIQSAELAFIDYDRMFGEKDARTILYDVIQGYIIMNSKKEMESFYKLISAERKFDPAAAQIMIEETKKMELAARNLFYAMQERGLLHITNMRFAVTFFCHTVHNLLELRGDYHLCGLTFSNEIENFIDGFIEKYGADL